MTTPQALAPAAAATAAVAGVGPTPREQVARALVALTTSISSVNAAASVIDYPLFREVTTALLDEVSVAQVALADAVAELLASESPPPPNCKLLTHRYRSIPADGETVISRAPTPGFIRGTGPWIAGNLYGVVPTAHIVAVPDHNEKWFAITRGKYIGLTKNSAISLNAVTGVSSGLADRCSSQADTVEYFNEALDAGAVVVIA
ncbi:hypothetical protein C8R43DRAFT_945104 [Mycena crocata]|nr:hypothetical protein C8R43DRAFT_945104 [Mycena crocata]